MSSVSIQPLEKKDYLAATGLLAHLNPDCPSETLIERFHAIIKEHPHYLPYGAFVDDQLVGFVGVWIATKIWCGKYLEIDNIVVHPEHRSSGIGASLVEAMEVLAREKDCNLVVLDSYTSNHASHRCYHRHGYEIWGFHFVKELSSITR